MEEYKEILEALEKSQFLDVVSPSTFPSFDIFKELVDAGYIEAIPNSKSIEDSRVVTGSYKNPQITPSGRKCLAELKAPKDQEAKPKLQKLLNNLTFASVVAAVVTALLARSLS